MKNLQKLVKNDNSVLITFHCGNAPSFTKRVDENEIHSYRWLIAQGKAVVLK